MTTTEIAPRWNYADSADRCAALRIGLALEHGYDHIWTGWWNTNIALTPQSMPGWSVRASHGMLSGTKELLVVRDGAAMTIRYTKPVLSVDLDARSMDIRDEVIRELQERFTELQPGPREVSADFWYHTPDGARSYSRVLATPSWSEIAANYAPSVRSEMMRLVDPSFVPGRGGQLLLWYGAAGSGKTFALRSLVREWSPWCTTSYITDVDAFLGTDASYVVRVLLQPSDYRGDRSGDRTNADERPLPLWHLVVLEDAGELLAADAAERSGQGFSRILNATDGMLGQGLPVLVLVTTNEPVDRLHPAVSRPGRCASRIEFGPLDQSSANRWLHEHGLPESVSGPRTLAELYALAEGRNHVGDTGRRVGFHLS